MIELRRKATEHFHSVLRFRNRSVINIRYISSLEKAFDVNRRWPTSEAHDERNAHQNSWIIRHVLRLWLLVLLLLLYNLNILHIASTKDYVVEFLLGGWDEIWDLAAFSAERIDIFEGNGGLIRIDLVQRPEISRRFLVSDHILQGWQTINVPNFTFRNKVEALAVGCQHAKSQEVERKAATDPMR